MTTEEKAKAYDEALERARKELKQDLHESGIWAIQRIFPELKESEDERIRRELIELVREIVNEPNRGGITVNKEEKYLAWLEKQKINTEGDFARGYDCGYEACLNSHGAEWLEKQKEQKDYRKLYEDIAKSEWFKKAYVGKSLGEENEQKEHQNNSDAPEKTLGRDLTFPQDKDKNLDEIAQDYVEGVKEYNPEPTWDLMQTAVCYGYHYCEQKEQMPLPEDTLIFRKGVEEGRRLMMEGAIAVEVVGEKRDLRLIDPTQRCLFNAKRGDWLTIFIVKEDGE